MEERPCEDTSWPDQRSRQKPIQPAPRFQTTSFQSSKKNKFLLFQPPVCDISLGQPQQTNAHRTKIKSSTRVHCGHSLNRPPHKQITSSRPLNNAYFSFYEIFSRPQRAAYYRWWSALQCDCVILPSPSELYVYQESAVLTPIPEHGSCLLP